MQISATGIFKPARHAHGFTLVEVLVVLFIIGISASFIILSAPSSERSRVDQYAQQLLEDFHYARDLALMRYSLVGWQVSQSGYQLALRHPDGRWIPHQSRAVPARPWPDHLQLDGIGDRPASLTPETPPALVFFPSGEMTPLTLDLRLGETVRQIQVKAGQLELLDLQHEK